jgi:cystathionine beta-lyase/cystathionine gamma-synthase
MTEERDTSHLHPETRAIRAGRADNDTALAPILWATTTFVTPTVDEARKMATGVGPSRFYARYGNPTVAGFEDAVAQLEGAEKARAFASGMGAISAVVLGLCSKGDHIVTQNQLYGATQLLFQGVCPRFGIDVTFVDGTEPGAFAAAVIPGRTTMIYAETPANPRLDLVDLAELGAIKGPVKVVDSTFATPFAQRPLEFGIDLVVHSATKGIAGHNDATIGVVAGAADYIDWLYSFAVIQGAVASPFDAMNALRGLRTLGVRLERQSKNAGEIAQFLEANSKVASVRWPGLVSHPQYELAQRQLDVPGGQLAFELVGGLDAGRTFVEAVQIAQLATSLGGPETLVTHPASTTHVGLSPEELEAAGIQPSTIRVSVGLEHADDLIADFAQAIDRIQTSE